MRILYVSKASLVASHRHKVRALADRVDVELVVPGRWKGAEFEPAPFDDGLRIHRLPVWLPGHNHLHLYRGLEDVFAGGGFDLVHVDEEPYSAVTWQLTRHARRHGVPALFFAWQNLEKRLPPPFGLLRGSVFRRSAGGIAGTETAAEVLRRAGYEGPLAVIPQMGVDVERFRPGPEQGAELRSRLGLDEGDFVVGYVGRLVPEKGLDLLVAAVATVPGARLVIVGGGDEAPRIAGLARSAGMEDRLVMTGPVPSLRIPRLMASFDVLALPSVTTPGWAEQFGRVLVEAMACGVPVVASDSGAIPDVVGDAGVIVPEGEADSLAEAIRRLGRDERRRASLAERGLARIRERYAQERVVEATVEFYEDLLGPEKARAVDGGTSGYGDGGV